MEVVQHEDQRMQARGVCDLADDLVHESVPTFGRRAAAERWRQGGHMEVRIGVEIGEQVVPGDECGGAIPSQAPIRWVGGTPTSSVFFLRNTTTRLAARWGQQWS